MEHSQQEATEQAEVGSRILGPIGLADGEDVALRGHGQRPHGLERRRLGIVVRSDLVVVILDAAVMAGGTGEVELAGSTREIEGGLL